MNLAVQTSKTEIQSPLSRLADLLSEDMAAINGAIMSKMQSEVPLIPQLASYLVSAGGKRLRPLLTIASAQLCGEHDHSRSHNLAACVEFIHTATLLHDDVVDDSDTRRGNQSANAVFGNEAAVLVGDFLFSRAFQLMVEDGSLDVLRILSGASAVIAEGEVMQLAAAHNLNTDFSSYLKVITAKTAALFAAACETGAVIANQDDEKCRALYDYGLNLGIAFQIADDVLDYKASQDKLGKSLGDDLRDGKITLPIIYALENANDDERTFWYKVFVKKEIDDNSLKRAVEICEAHNSFDRALDTAKEYSETAIKSLNEFHDGEIKSLFIDMCDYVINRSK